MHGGSDEVLRCASQYRISVLERHVAGEGMAFQHDCWFSEVQ